MNKHEGLPFKTYVPQFVANLEDADPGVRDVAKRAVVDLFQYADPLVTPWQCASTNIETGMPRNTQK
jgi:hypothetical protein